jgi:hypothetical protein
LTNRPVNYIDGRNSVNEPTLGPSGSKAGWHVSTTDTIRAHGRIGFAQVCPLAPFPQRSAGSWQPDPLRNNKNNKRQQNPEETNELEGNP